LELFKKWGDEGFKKHIESIQAFYQEKKEIFCKLAEKHLKGLATFVFFILNLQVGMSLKVECFSG
jgi:DNA-binding transcriptional MocR family regulator